MPVTTSKSINPPPLKANGGIIDLTEKFNINDPEFRREIMRPSDIKEDVKLMSTRKRVSLILKSESFRRDLEDIVKLQLHSGPYPDNWTTIQSLSDYVTPHAQYGVASSTFNKGLVMPTMPINDLAVNSHKKSSGTTTSPRSKYSKTERINRCKLASVLRLIDIFGWNSGMTSCVTVRIGHQSDQFLINPFGLLFHEVTATSLIKIDLNDNIIDSGSSGLQIDRGAWFVPSAIYATLPKIRCVIQLKNSATIAVSAMKCGLLPLSQEALSLGKVVIYDPFSSSALTATAASNGDVITESQNATGDERVRIGTTMEENSRVLLVRSHGLYAFGVSVEEAWHHAFNAMAACQSQLKLLLIGSEKLSAQSSGESLTTDLLNTVRLHLGSDESVADNANATAACDAATVQTEFEALMQQLDQAGYRTGYIYRSAADQAMVPANQLAGDVTTDDEADLLSLEGEERQRQDSLRRLPEVSEVVLPPTATSISKCGVEGEESTATLPPAAGLAVNSWATTPNAYKREQITEIGTSNPKQITRWLPEPDKQTSGLAEAVQSSNQFAPQGADSHELAQQQRLLKQFYYEDAVQAGPQSRIVEEGSLDEARTLQLAREGRLPSDRVVVVGAVSRAIIQRHVQHNVGAYRSVYSTNPFQQVSEHELAQYRREVQRNLADPVERARMEEEDRVIAAREQQAQAAAAATAAGSVEDGDVVTVARTVAAQHAAPSAHRGEIGGSTLAASQSTGDPRSSHFQSGSGAVGRRTDTSDVDATTHTEVTDVEARDASGKEKKKKRRFKNPFKKSKPKE